MLIPDRIKKLGGVLRTGKVTSLVTVHNLRNSDSQGFAAGFKDKVNLHTVIHFPMEDKTKGPIDDGCQIKQVSFYRYVSDSD